MMTNTKFTPKRPRSRRRSEFSTFLGQIIVATGSVAFLCSCSVVSSQQADWPVANDAATQNALVYFLPSGRLHVTGSFDTNSGWSVSANAVYVPDVAHPYYFRYEGSGLSSDDVSITTTPEGFLSSIDAKTADQTPAIVQSVGQLAENILKLAAVGGAGTKTNGTSFDVVINPFNAADRDVLNANMSPDYTVHVICDLDHHPVGDFNASGAGYSRHQAYGIFYRPFLPYRVTFEPANTGTATIGHTPTQSVEVYLPNEAPVLALKINRAAFVTNETVMAFTNGVPTSVHYTKPSEVAAFIQIPIGLTTELLSIPNDLLTLRIQHITNETAVNNDLASQLNAQNTLIQAQTNLINAQQSALAAAQARAQAAAPAAASPTTGATAVTGTTTSSGGGPSGNIPSLTPH